MRTVREQLPGAAPACAAGLIVVIAVRFLLPVLAIVLPIFGAVLGVVQVALGLEVMNDALRVLLAK